MSEEVYVALGSNMAQPKQHILDAISQINEIPMTKVLAASSLYQTKPWGFLEQNDFINAVVKCHTLQMPEAFLSALFKIENRHGRLRHQKNGPRTLDCDLLLFGQHQMDSPSLTIPHPRMLERRFVLIPLLEIAPNLIIPGGKAIATYLSDCPPWPLTKIEEEKII